MEFNEFERIQQWSDDAVAATSQENIPSQMVSRLVICHQAVIWMMLKTMPAKTTSVFQLHSNLVSTDSSMHAALQPL